MKLSAPELRKAIDLYKSGHSLRQVAKILSRDRAALARMLRKSRIEIRQERGRRVHHFNQRVFEVIDTPEKAYFLGFLFADGSNDEKSGRILLEVARRDESHLRKFVRFLSSSHKVRRRRKTSNQRTSSSKLSIQSRALSADLASHGCVQRKSLVLKFPNIVDAELRRSFIRGYFDGDGCITTYWRKERRKYKSSCDFAGTRDFLSEVATELSGTLGLQPRLYQQGKIWRLYVSKHQDVKELLEYLYRESGIYLDRKYRKAQQVLMALSGDDQRGRKT